MTATEQELMAFVDGELGPEDFERVASAIKNDPALDKIVQRLRAAKQAARSAYNDIETAPLSPGLATLIADIDGSVGGSASTENTVVAFHQRLGRLAGLIHGSGPWPAVAAACLVLGALSGRFMFAPPDQDGAVLVAMTDGALTAGGALAGVLESEPAGGYQSFASGAISMETSFLSVNGEYCRQFAIRTESAGVACRTDGVWRIAVIADAPSDSYAAASGGDDPLAAATARIGVERLLSTEEEAELIERAWLLEPAASR